MPKITVDLSPETYDLLWSYVGNHKPIKLKEVVEKAIREHLRRKGAKK